MTTSRDCQMMNYIYKDSQIAPNTLSILQDKIEDDYGLGTLTIEDFDSKEWIERIVSLATLVINRDDKEKIGNILFFWMSGLRYVTIADEMEIPIDEIVYEIEWLRGEFLQVSKSILRYICMRFNIHNGALNDWSFMVEKGLNTKNQVMMFRKGLSDRIALHAIDDAILNNKLMTEDKNVLYDFLHTQKMKILTMLEYNGLPKLTIERVEDFL